nr:unnamed protein product [Callosobruchus analis]
MSKKETKGTLLNFVQRKDSQKPSTSSAPSNTDESEYSPQSSKKRKSFVRHYISDYLKYGFVLWPQSEENCPKPECVVCRDVLSNESMKPSKLLRHLQSKHPQVESKPLDFFKRKSLEMKIQKDAFKKCFLVDKSLLKASYLVALRIAKSKKPYSVAEDLLKPCLIDVCCEVLGQSAADKMKTLPLSNDTIGRRICELSDDVESQLLQDIRKSKWFAVLMDESIDVSNNAILLCYVRYIDYEINDIREELMCCIELPSQTTGAEIFKAVNTYMENNSIDWKNASRITDVASEGLVVTHCIIHREHLAAKKLSPQLNDILLESVKIVNFIKSNALNSRLFTTLCQEMGSDHVQLLLHAEIRWLSRGKVLKRLYKLRNEVQLFLNEKGSLLSRHFQNKEWVALLSYLSDIFSLINELNLSLQGKTNTVFNFYNKIDAFKKKLKLWYKRAQENNFDMFASFFDYINTNDIDQKSVISVILKHLNELSIAFDQYYPPEEDVRSGNMWVINPFIDNCNNNLTTVEETELIELSSDLALKSQFNSVNIYQFWIKIATEYHNLHAKAMKIVLPFSSTYLCETTFSAMTVIKTKHRNRLALAPALRIAVTGLTPRIDALVSNKDQQQSH